jgi:hypothetical protein
MAVGLMLPAAPDYGVSRKWITDRFTTATVVTAATRKACNAGRTPGRSFWGR